MGKDGRYPGPNRISKDQCCMPHPDAGHIRDGIQGSRGQHPENDPVIADSGVLAPGIIHIEKADRNEQAKGTHGIGLTRQDTKK